LQPFLEGYLRGGGGVKIAVSAKYTQKLAQPGLVKGVIWVKCGIEGKYRKNFRACQGIVRKFLTAEG
jgi:hypothetical protein